MGWTKPSLFGFGAGVKIAKYGFGSPKLFLLHRLRNPAPPLRLFLHVPRYVQYNTGTVPNCFASSRALKTMPSCVSFAGYFNFVNFGAFCQKDSNRLMHSVSKDTQTLLILKSTLYSYQW